MVAVLCEARWSRLSGLPLSRSYAMNNRFGSALGLGWEVRLTRELDTVEGCARVLDTAVRLGWFSLHSTAGPPRVLYLAKRVVTRAVRRRLSY
jgi:hypothetical protein